MKTIDVSADVGESFVGGMDAIEDALMEMVSSCHVSCGVHSGDEGTVARTIESAMKHGVRMGAHPSYPDREHGGRRSMDIGREELSASIRSQLDWLKERMFVKGGQLCHVKPHGALYNDLAKDRALCEAVLGVVHQFDAALAVYGMAGSLVGEVCEELGLKFVAEGFVDRRYEDARTLVPRSEPGAVLEEAEEVEEQIKNWVHGKVVDRYDRTHLIVAGSLCLHSDASNVLVNADLVRKVLKEDDVAIAAPQWA